MLHFLQESNNKVDNFYTSTGIHVYIKDPLTNGLDMEEIVSVVENRIPKKFLIEVEMIIVGDLEEFKDRKINAMYKDSCLYITNEQDDADDLIDDIYNHAIKSGALGGKIMGAGGGGFFIFYVPEERHLSFRNKIKTLNLKQLNWNFDYDGVIQIYSS